MHAPKRSATIEHVAPRQHAPVVIGHGGGRHIVPSPWNTPGLTHAVRVTTVHAPVVAQHAPIGCGHVALPHVVTVGMNVPAHSPATVSVQLPSSAQHAPIEVDGHGGGVHATPTCQLETFPHAGRSVEVHAPVVRLQHAPV